MKLSLSPNKLNDRGFQHIILPVIVAIAVAGTGIYVYGKSHAAPITTPSSSVTNTIPSDIAGKCLDDWDDSTTLANKIDLSSCNGTDSQVWTVESNGTVENNGNCLDVKQQSKSNGALIDLYKCNGGANQQWKDTDNTLVNPISGKCLDDPNSGTTDGVQLQLYTCNGTSGETWYVPVTPVVLHDNLFPIGVWDQPSFEFTTWKERGVNTVVGVPQGSTEPSWDAAAIADGLYEIRGPASNPASDTIDKNLLAWAQSDEPDDIGTQIPYSTIQQTYTRWKDLDPKIPVYINFNGSFNQYNLEDTKQNGVGWYKEYAKGADWISADHYPVNSGQGSDLGVIGTEVSELREIAGSSKPTFAYIETGNYNTKDGYPTITPDQFRGEVWEAIIHGVRGIWYFPEQLSPTFEWDSTPPDVVAEMIAQDNTINSLASILQGPLNPLRLSATVSSPLQVAWRSSGGDSYFFVLNLSDSTLNNQTIQLGGIGSATTATVLEENRAVPITNETITDNFSPYAVHIYQIR